MARPLTDDQVPVVAASLNELENRLSPSRREWIIAILARLAVAYDYASKDTEAFGIQLSDMADDLEEFSEAHIAQACIEWRKSQTFFPKAGELRRRLVELDAYDRCMRRRARILLGIEEARNYDLPIPSQGDGDPPPKCLVNIEESLKKMPPELAGSISRLLDAAKNHKQRARQTT